MSKDHEPEVIVYSDSDAISVFVDGVKIAKRGHPGTPQAMTWVSLEPGWKVFSPDDHSTITIEYNSVRVH
jgi:hypothetical protein